MSLCYTDAIYLHFKSKSTTFQGEQQLKIMQTSIDKSQKLSIAMNYRNIMSAHCNCMCSKIFILVDQIIMLSYFLEMIGAYKCRVYCLKDGMN